jgi:hypothetical protein
VAKKSDTFSVFKRYKAYAENHFGLKIKALQEDEGGEYMSNKFGNFLAAHGIMRRHSTRNRPQQNGMAERANRTVDEHATAMLHEANLPPSFKGLAVAAYIHVGNMCPNAHLPPDTQMCLISGSGDALLMCMCRRIRGMLQVATSRSVSLLDILQSTRHGSSIIL